MHPCLILVDPGRIWVKFETPQTPTKIFIEAGPVTQSRFCARSRLRFAPLSREHFLPVAESIDGRGHRLKKIYNELLAPLRQLRGRVPQREDEPGAKKQGSPSRLAS